MTKKKSLVIKNLSKTFIVGDRAIEALSQINLTVASGEFLNVIGPSGCGKSTLLRCIADFETPTSGELILNGSPIKGPGIDRMMVFQNFEQLFPWYTVRQNIIFALSVTERCINKKEKRERADYYLNLVGLRGFEGLYPHQLSGGMQQRVAIARALSVRPQILLMDEPFGSLDAITRAALQKELIRIWQETKVTIIFVTHNINESIILSDRILVLEANPGRIKLVLKNSLKRPRQPDSPEFNQLWEKIHTLLDAAGGEKKQSEKRGELPAGRPLAARPYFLEVEMARKNNPRD
ncbi:MAG TPA: ABC transporter ATP-binding protein [Firmicutes bacterium]|nr:ABC transporter ATP-binding protein [Bacillota bacterium]